MKEYLVKDFLVNQQAKVNQLQETLDSIKALTGIATRQEVIKEYSYALDTLDRYDYQTLEINNTTKEEQFQANYYKAMEVTDTLRKKLLVVDFSLMKKTNHSKALLIPSIKLSKEKIYIQV